MARFLTGLALVLATAVGAAAQPGAWVTSWATSEMAAEGNNVLPAADLAGATLRQLVRLSIGGSQIRLTLSNAFGTAPLHLLAVHVAKPVGGGAIDPASDKAVSFAGRSDVVIPAGGVYISDPVAMAAAPLSDLAISIRYEAAPPVETSHPGSRMTSYIAAGDHVADAALPNPKTVDHWYQIAALDVQTGAKAGAVVVLGDSITDGRGSTTNGNDRWTNILAERLAANRKTKDVGVLNAGIGGNCVLAQCLGPNALARFERDVLAPSGAKALIVLEGVNDLGSLTRDHAMPAEEHAALVTRLIAGFEQMAVRAHAHGMKAFIATILPYAGSDYYHPDAANEADRNAVNAWIRSQHAFDGVIDFDAATHDRLRPDHLNPSYDSGDFLHPSPAGYRVMGELAAKVLGGAQKGKLK